MKTRTIESGFEVVRILTSILLAFGLALIALIFVSEDPVSAIQEFLIGPFRTLRRIGNMVELAIPFTFTGLGICFMYSANQFNVAGEGIFYISGCLTALVCLNISSLQLPPVLYITVLVLVGGLIGIAFASIPALLKVKWGVNEVVISIMLNSILMYLGKYILINFMRDPEIAYNASYKLPQSALIPDMIPGTRIHWGLVIAIAFVLLTALIIYRTPLGYSMRLVGKNQQFARYSGVNITFAIISAQLLGGFMAGVGGSVELLGMYERFQWTNLTQHGFDGMLVAILAKTNPLLVPFTALLLAYLRIGADLVNMTADIPAEFITVIQAIVIMLVAAEMFLVDIKNKIIYSAAKRKLRKEESE